MASVFSDDAYEFYEGLRADNSKTYWTEHKDVYSSAVRAPMQELFDQLADRFDGTAKLFRPYRDVRFSADKTPYKTAQGGVVEVAAGLGFWMQLDADGVMVGGGFQSPDTTQVTRYRAAVDDETSGTALAKLLAKLAKAGFVLGGSVVKTRPRGVAADHPRLELMRHASVTVSRRVGAAEPINATSVAADWTRVKPLVDWARTQVVS
jgi:uncharacterized protein (TIGR02453 family)